MVRRTCTGLLVALAAAAILVACSAAGTSGTSTDVSPSVAASSSPVASRSVAPAPTGGALARADLDYRLVDALGLLWFCDPDQHPVARDDEEALAEDRFDEIRRDGNTFAAIVDRLALEGSSFDSDDKLAIYREWKMLQAISLEPAGADGFAFDYLARPAEGGTTGTRSTGTISTDGELQVDHAEKAPAPACPICLARGTMIETPAGAVAVEDLRLGQQVWSFDAAGRRIHVPILRLGSMAAPEDHRVIRLRLDDGRQVTASPSHPLADGRRLGDVGVGDGVDAAIATSITVLPYGGERTYDLLPAGPTGLYLAGGIPMASTLHRLAQPLATLADRPRAMR
jgi:hypothetical protein